MIALMPNMVENIFWWFYDFLVYGNVRNLGCDKNTTIFLQVGLQQDTIIFNSTTIKVPDPEKIYSFSIPFNMYNQYKHYLYFEWRSDCTRNYGERTKVRLDGVKNIEFEWSNTHWKYMCNVGVITL
uniref:Methyltransf_FA domain-containing protein n=1 Tax=Strongyloides papillosus TaxID=174720 RepID=A0A0N5C7W6_STREA